MSLQRILLIENPAGLSIHLGRLKLARIGEEDVFIAPQDIAVLVLHHTTIELSVHVLRVLAQHASAVMITDEKHHPVGLHLPLVGNLAQPLRLRHQITFERTQVPKELWRHIVQSRIRGEAANLRALQLKGSLRLQRMADEVQPGDAGKLEGQAARHYWAHLFPENFRRTKQGANDPINARLNFGYAVLRALIARAIVAAGLQPALGLGHNNQENPFNLADDFMEPYRFIVERHIWEDPGRDGEFDSASRKMTAALIQKTVALNGNEYRLPIAVEQTISSYCRILETRGGDLVLPFLSGGAKDGRKRMARHVGNSGL